MVNYGLSICFDTMSVIGGGEKDKAVREKALVVGGKENETKGECVFIISGEKTSA